MRQRFVCPVALIGNCSTVAVRVHFSHYRKYIVTFEKLALHPDILKAINDCGYTSPTPIQNQAIPAALAGHDLMASGKYSRNR